MAVGTDRGNLWSSCKGGGAPISSTSRIRRHGGARSKAQRTQRSAKNNSGTSVEQHCSKPLASASQLTPRASATRAAAPTPPIVRALTPPARLPRSGASLGGAMRCGTADPATRDFAGKPSWVVPALGKGTFSLDTSGIVRKPYPPSDVGDYNDPMVPEVPWFRSQERVMYSNAPLLRSQVGLLIHNARDGAAADINRSPRDYMALFCGGAGRPSWSEGQYGVTAASPLYSKKATRMQRTHEQQAAADVHGKSSAIEEVPRSTQSASSRKPLSVAGGGKQRPSTASASRNSASRPSAVSESNGNANGGGTSRTSTARKLVRGSAVSRKSVANVSKANVHAKVPAPKLEKGS
eukprot:TRINITY_DN4601_c0_g1_i2.p1 TRINITY_DN4601_c0_g1~~TRINITY_DN4601_c0_g1_i2.p1  ORF type:complete len:379 (-),score=43.44 TRINITY_DN4601_c0_g1_i2:67-1119(-)